MTEQSENAILARLAQLEDREEITDLLYRYSSAIDGRDWDLLRGCFVPDGTADYREFGAATEGIESVVAMCDRVLSGLDASHHLIGNPRITLEGDRATSTCYVQAQHFLASKMGANTLMAGGRYEDELVRTADGWRIVKRVMFTTWTTGNVGVFTEAAERLAATAG
jgi:SnoaL-like domain